MATPIINFGEYTFCFDAEDEDISMREHFIAECGWSQKDYARIRDYAWFCAKVTVWKDGEELGSDYLGACCYKTEKQFYTTYKGDYFADMVRECAGETKDPALIAIVDNWHTKLRIQTDKRIAAKQAKREARASIQAPN
jgi:hypothetical protein